MALSIPSAASASLPSAKSSVSRRWKYDVFFNFGGEDTRKGIISHLNLELEKTGGIKTFKDDERLPVGAPISPNRLRAIQESRFAIVLLSPNYASSSWCLDELVNIFQCMESEERILPIFFEVDPSDVRHQRGSFEVAFTKHEKFVQDIEKLKQWKVALGKLANLSGWDTKYFRSEFELVQEIVKFLNSKIKYVSVGPYGSRKGENRFDDGVYSTVRQVEICSDSSGICYIQIEYDSYGISLWSDMHGSCGIQETTEKVVLDYPDEYLTSIHGYYEKVWFLPTQIVSLAFHSNKRIYGPFGRTSGDSIDDFWTNFSIQMPGSKIVGFHGTGSDWTGLRAIGAHLQPI